MAKKYRTICQGLSMANSKKYELMNRYKSMPQRFGEDINDSSNTLVNASFQNDSIIGNRSNPGGYKKKFDLQLKLCNNPSEWKNLVKQSNDARIVVGFPHLVRKTKRLDIALKTDKTKHGRNTLYISTSQLRRRRDHNTIRSLAENLSEMEQIATSKAEQGYWEESLSILENILQRQKASLGDSHPDLAKTLYHMGVALTNLGMIEYALSRLLEGVNILFPKKDVTTNLELASLLYQIGILHNIAGDIDAAIHHFSYAQKVEERIFRTKSSQISG